MFGFEARRATIGGIQISEGRRLVDSKFHCSYLDSRGVLEKNAWYYLSFTSGSGDVISGDATSGDVTILTNPPQILIEPADILLICVLSL